MSDKTEIGPFSEVAAFLRMASDCQRRTIDQCPLDAQDEVDWDYVCKQLERAMKHVGEAYTSARKTRDQRRAEKEQNERLQKARAVLDQAQAKMGVNRG